MSNKGGASCFLGPPVANFRASYNWGFAHCTSKDVMVICAGGGPPSLDLDPHPGAPEECEAAGAAISKGHLLLSHHFSGRQYLLKLYCMDTRLLVAIVGRQTSTSISNNFICCTMLRAQNKISKRTCIAWFSINQGPRNRGAMGPCASPLF
jgi:hypothetical protein